MAPRGRTAGRATAHAVENGDNQVCHRDRLAGPATGGGGVSPADRRPRIGARCSQLTSPECGAPLQFPSTTWSRGVHRGRPGSWVCLLGRVAPLRSISAQKPELTSRLTGNGVRPHPDRFDGCLPITDEGPDQCHVCSGAATGRPAGRRVGRRPGRCGQPGADQTVVRDTGRTGGTGSSNTACLAGRGRPGPPGRNALELRRSTPRAIHEATSGAGST
jgi:hypothetical protein